MVFKAYASGLTAPAGQMLPGDATALPSNALGKEALA